MFEETHTIDERTLPTELPCPICGDRVEMAMTYGGLADVRTKDLRPHWFRDRLKEIKKKHPKGKINA
jgi:hypothetical protein